MTEQQGTILVVDDAPAILQLLQKMLSMQGYEVRVANSGAQALESVKANPPEWTMSPSRFSQRKSWPVSQLA